MYIYDVYEQSHELNNLNKLHLDLITQRDNILS